MYQHKNLPKHSIPSSEEFTEGHILVWSVYGSIYVEISVAVVQFMQQLNACEQTRC